MKLNSIVAICFLTLLSMNALAVTKTEEIEIGPRKYLKVGRCQSHCTKNCDQMPFLGDEKDYDYKLNVKYQVDMVYIVKTDQGELPPVTKTITRTGTYSSQTSDGCDILRENIQMEIEK